MSVDLDLEDLSLAQRLAMLPPDLRAQAMEGIDPEEFLHDWHSWRRKSQSPPDGDWSTWLLMAGRGCIAGETRLDLADGSTVRVDDACRAGEPLTVMSLHDDGTVKPTHAEAPFLKGFADIWTVTLEDGHAIAVTDEHKFLTPQGWMKLSAAGIGSRFAVVGSISEDRPGGGLLLKQRVAAGPSTKWLAGLESVVWRQVVSVESRGKEPFYDLHVPEVENYVANGIISHNSGKTRAASEFIHERVRDGLAHRILLLGRTAADVRDVMIHGEALALDTVVPTPTGWTTMGAVQTGDTVIGGNGKPCRVEEAFDVLNGRTCYRLTFKSGATVVADADHKWVTWDAASRKKRTAGKVKVEGAVHTTREIADSFWSGGTMNHAVDVVGAHYDVRGEIPIDPYMLGVWLGTSDGKSAGIHLDGEDADQILTQAGKYYEISPRTYLDGRTGWWTVNRLKPLLKNDGLLQGKHIPVRYLRMLGSHRLALLQGIMDTAGTVDVTGGCQITVPNARLRDDVVELLASLRIVATDATTAPLSKASLRVSKGEESYRVLFRTNLSVTTLDRHLDHLVRNPDVDHEYDYITAVNKIQPVPVRCIRVDSPDHLFLVTNRYIPTHNSGLLNTGRPEDKPEYFPSKRLVVWPNGAEGLLLCVDPETHALTPDGWVTHDKLKPGDLIRVLDVETGMSRWSPIKNMHRYDAVNEPMISVEQNYHSSFSTLHHRWPVMDKSTRKRKWRESLLDFNTKDSFITGALGDDLPTEAKYADALVALVGWYTTEGHLETVEMPEKFVCHDRDGLRQLVRTRLGYLKWSYQDVGDRLGVDASSVHGMVKDGLGKPDARERFADALGIATSSIDAFFGPFERRTWGSIVQNTASPHEPTIRAWLTELFGPAVPSFKELRYPAWRDTRTRTRTAFLLNHEAVQILSAHAPGKDKVVPYEFISALTRNQLELFVRSAIDGDGSWKSGGRVAVIAQKVGARLESIEFAAMLLGWSVRRDKKYCTLSVSHTPKLIMPGTKSPDSKVVFEQANLTFNKDTRPVLPVHPYNDRRKIAEYTGTVWCPETEEGTWLAQRHGTVYYTGNSADEPDQARGPQADTAWCIAAGEDVLSRRGWVPIDDIRVGDEVMTRQDWKRVDAARAMGIKPVIKVTTATGTLRCTPDHKIWSARRGWTHAGELVVGEMLYGPDRVGVAVVSIDVDGTAPVYDLTVHDAHEFYTNGILTKNCDEFASFPGVTGSDGATAFDNLRLGLRLPVPGDQPRMILTTTPRRTKAMFEILEQAKDPKFGIVITRGSTYENLGNLADSFRATIIGLYEGTRLGRQELMGEMLTDMEGSLFLQEWFDMYRVKELPSGRMYAVVGVDPSVAERPTDECGIVVVKATMEKDFYKRHVYICEDASVKGSPDIWAGRVAAMARKWNAPIVAEGNQGGELVRMAIAQADSNLPVHIVHARTGKATRAEPVAAAMQQGRVHMVGWHQELEDQMVNWIPAESRYSPDHLDAAVWGVLSVLTRQKGVSFALGRHLRARSTRTRLPAMNSQLFSAKSGRR